MQVLSSPALRTPLLTPAQLIVIASIHQPSTKTLDLFSKLTLLSKGRTCFYGSVSEIDQYFHGLQLPIPPLTNPAEHMLDMTNVDFGDDEAQARLNGVFEGWQHSERADDLRNDIASLSGHQIHASAITHPSMVSQIMTLLHRSFLKSYRDILAYGIRIAMYMGLAVMMGTVWVRLSPTQQHIQPFVNAIVSLEH